MLNIKANLTPSFSGILLILSEQRFCRTRASSCIEYVIDLFPRYFDLVLLFFNLSTSFRDTHWGKAPSNKTQALTKSTNTDIWVIGNYLSVRGFYTRIKFSKK